MDVFFDEKYGGVIFKTVAGVTKCPHEEGTMALEIPRLSISRYAPANVLPDEKMLFEVELTNDGVGNETIFILYTGLLGNLDGKLK